MYFTYHCWMILLTTLDIYKLILTVLSRSPDLILSIANHTVLNISLICHHGSRFAAVTSSYSPNTLLRRRCIHRARSPSLILKRYITCNRTLLWYRVFILCLRTIIHYCLLISRLINEFLHLDSLLAILRIVRDSTPNVLILLIHKVF